MKNLLLLVQEEFKKRAFVEEFSDDNKDTDYNGLCYVVIILFRAGKVKLNERYALIDLIKSYALTRKTWYTYEGRKTDNPSQFIWRANDRPSRLRWLRTQIATY